MRTTDQPPSGRHRWGGEKPALLILGGVVALALVLGLLLVVFGGDSEPVPDTADDSGSTSSSASTSASPSGKSPGAASSKSKKYTPGKNPHGAKEVCGGGFKPIDKLTVKSGSTTLGTVNLLFNAGNGANCVVTLKAVDIGKKTPMTASLSLKGGKSGQESGSFGYYAGPVKREAARTCVKWSGSIDGVAVDSGDWSHCG